MLEGGAEAWSFETPGLGQSPAVGADGTIYVVSVPMASRTAGQLDARPKSMLTAVGPDGTERWQRELEGTASSGAAIDSDGALVIATDSHLMRVGSAGEEMGAISTQSIHTPIIGGDGRTYIASADVRAFNADGTEQWRYETLGFAVGAPAVGRDGLVYAAAPDSSGRSILYAFHERGPKHRVSAPWPVVRGDPANTGRATR